MARDTVLTNEEHVNVKRPKTSGDVSLSDSGERHARTNGNLLV